MRFQKGLHVIAILAIAAASGCVQEPKRVDVSREAVTHHAENTGEANESNTTPLLPLPKQAAKRFFIKKTFVRINRVWRISKRAFLLNYRSTWRTFYTGYSREGPK